MPTYYQREKLSLHMKIFVPALLALSLTSTVYAVPTKAVKPIERPLRIEAALTQTGEPTKVPLKIEIDARARAIVERGAALYRSTQGLSAKWQRTEDGKTDVASFDFDRAGRVRTVNCYSEEPLTVFDGKISWALNNPSPDGKGPTTFRRQTVETNDAEWLARQALEGVGGLPGLMTDFPYNFSPLNEERIQKSAEKSEFLELHAKLLPAQPLARQACDLVRITTVAHSSYIAKHPVTTSQDTYWFARSDGRLMRLQRRVIIASKQVSSSDIQIITQTLNPTFAPDTFEFTPPKGAVLQKN